MYKITVKRVILGVLFFVLLYFEDLAVGSLTLGQIWKMPLILYGLLYVVAQSRSFGMRLPGFLVVGILLSAKIVLNTGFPGAPLPDLAEAVYALALPLSIAFLSFAFSDKIRDLVELLMGLSMFFILSNIPFLLGILAQRRTVTSLGKFGLKEETALSGLFFNISTTSKILVVSTVIWIASRKYLGRSPLGRLLYLSVAALGVYSVYRAYTRTGWLMLLVGLAVLAFYKTKVWKVVLFVLPLTAVLGLFIVQEVKDNQALRMRIRGETVYRPNESNNANLILSFRLDLYRYSLENITGQGAGALMLGYGKARSLELMEISMGRPQISHNRLLEILQYGGIAALALYMLFLWKLFQFIRALGRRCSHPNQKLIYALFLIFGIAVIPSHGFPIWADLLFGGIIALSVIGGGAVLLEPPDLDGNP